MSTVTATPYTDGALAESDAVGLGPILVATDGTGSSRSALKAAAHLAAHSESDVVVLTVLEPLPVVAADYGIMLPLEESGQTRRYTLLERVKAQVAEVAGARSGWKIDLREGDPAYVIATTARETRSRLVILGIGHHDLLDRLFGGETALRTLRLTKKPVFAVAPKYGHLPKRVVIATDFSAGSIRAARTALELFDTIAMVYVVHVAPRIEMQPEAFATWMALYGEGVGPAFERVKAELGLPSKVTVETITLEGKPSRKILAFARSANVDLIITGSRGAGLVDRLLVGSTATGLVRGAQCSVLAVPTLLGSERGTAIAEAAKVSLPQERWAAELEAFTKRNAGRRAALEVDDPELGAQAQEHDYPFLGAAYDHHDDRVEIMLGDFEGVNKRHLTRGIANVREIDVLRDAHGRDWILRVSHGDGQTILTLAR